MVLACELHGVDHQCTSSFFMYLLIDAPLSQSISNRMLRDAIFSSIVICVLICFFCSNVILARACIQSSYGLWGGGLGARCALDFRK